MIAGEATMAMAGVRWIGRRGQTGIMADRDFRCLWVGLTGSLFGSQITQLAVPLIGALTLGASPFQMGLLAAMSQAPFLVVSLPAGVWVDRVRRRPLLIAADLGSALMLTTIPLAALLGVLTLPLLMAVAFGVGTLTALGEIAHYAYVPGLIGRDHLVEGNSRIQMSYSAAESAGPGIGGILIQVLSAPVAIIADAMTFLVSAWMTSHIAHREPVPAAAALHGTEPLVGEGIRFLLGHRLLRPIVLVSMASELFGGAILALFILYATRELDLGAIAIGLILTTGGLFAIPRTGSGSDRPSSAAGSRSPSSGSRSPSRWDRRLPSSACSRRLLRWPV
jgi:MFS family permease